MPATIQRYLIIGDVHGCYSELMELLKKVHYDQKSDQLVFVGDLINKGPLSREVLEFAYNHRAKVVLGNHEMGLIRYVEENIIKGHDLNVTKLALGKDLPFWIDWMKKLPIFLEFDDFTIVHAGKIPDRELSEDDREILCTMRTWDQKNEDFQNPNNPLWCDFYKDKKLIIYGHHAIKGLVIRDNVTGLDTGCVYGGKLSLLIMPERKIVQVDASRQYYPMDS
ncbi:MAG: hypothetical protein HN576_12245 [Bacteriovoracaceae bacterium]|jgi:serine/threonine protein phosphatase 1|nr:hypothetical protein [Bacteriovoracaceae bacterium]